jgi:hypothetical protein
MLMLPQVAISVVIVLAIAGGAINALSGMHDAALRRRQRLADGRPCLLSSRGSHVLRRPPKPTNRL